MILQLALAFISTFAFAVLFSAPKSQYFLCGFCGAFTWGIYLASKHFENDPVLSALFATFFLTVLARFLSVKKKNPVTIYLITGVFPLVPGAGIYYTSYYLIMNENRDSLLMGVSTLKTAGAIALGIILGFALPFSLKRPHSESKRK